MRSIKSIIRNSFKKVLPLQKISYWLRRVRDFVSIVNIRLILKIFLRREMVLKLYNQGLAGRLFTFATTSVACKERKWRMKLIWIKNYLCGCDFSDLFDNDIERANDDAATGFDDFVSFAPRFLTMDKHIFYSDLFFTKFNNALPGLHGLCVLNREAREAIHFELNLLRPKKIIENKLLSFPPNTIGVHIRMTDSSWKKFINYDWFDKRMEQLIKENDQIVFFLATDCAVTRDKYLKKFPNKILYYESELAGLTDSVSCRRGTIDGAQQALLDLLTLSRTSRILGTYGSTFGWLASLWGDIPIEFNVPEKLTTDI